VADSGVSPAFELVVAVALSLSLLALALALIPSRALPMPLADVIDARREVLGSAAVAVVVGLAAGLVVLVIS
jgi:hypothetical protein